MKKTIKLYLTISLVITFNALWAQRGSLEKVTDSLTGTVNYVHHGVINAQPPVVATDAQTTTISERLDTFRVVPVRVQALPTPNGKLNKQAPDSLRRPPAPQKEVSGK